MGEDIVVYRIDNKDTITGVSGNWQSFARENAWAGALSPENVVGHVLWDFVQDMETRHLYNNVLERVRAGKRVGPIPFRCDSPDERRSLKLLLTLLPDGQVEFTSTIVRSEFRDPVKLLDKGVPRSSELVRICSMCKKIAVSQSEWVEVEDGLAQLPF